MALCIALALKTHHVRGRSFREKLGSSVQFTEATRKAADAWRCVDEEIKKKYASKSALLKEKYQKEKEEYKAKKEQESKEAAQRQLVGKPHCNLPCLLCLVACYSMQQLLCWNVLHHLGLMRMSLLTGVGPC